jgi:hypothetical protein
MITPRAGLTAVTPRITGRPAVAADPPIAVGAR